MHQRPQFSTRLPADFTPNSLQASIDRGASVTDLMRSNPTQCGFDYPDVQVPLVGEGAFAYSPEPFGLPRTREALAAYLVGVGQRIAAKHLLLTASTSEAYSMLFKLLCNPGDAVAVGAPTYPLVAHLAELENVRVESYTLCYTHRWCLDLDSVAQVLQRGVKALVLIAPNNPTGACLRADEAADLARLCGQYGVPLIVDEVFAPYNNVLGTPCAADLLAAAPLYFILRGLSKEVGLPQLKLGWVGIHGDPAWVEAVVPRLEWIADTYLSVSTPVQQALPTLLGYAPAIQQQIRARVQANRAALTQRLGALAAVSVLASDGGWYAILEMPQHVSEDAWVLALAQQGSVVMHPGYFYDFTRRGYLVCGLLVHEKEFDSACGRAVEVLRAYLE